MKKTKMIILAILLVLGFVLQSEIFMEEIWNFNTGYYLSTDLSFEDERERVRLLEDLYACAEEEGVEVFATAVTGQTRFQHELRIYGDSPSIRTLIDERHGIEERSYSSLMSGNMDVTYHEFLELCDSANRYIFTVSFIGEDEAAYRVYEDLHGMGYELTYPLLVGGSDRDVIYLMWTVIAVLLVVMTCIEILYKKKEVVVRVSLGQGVWPIIFRSMAAELLADLVEFVLVRAVVFRFISGEFMRGTVFLLYLLGIAASCACYLSYAVYDVRRAFSNANDAQGLLNLTYGVKIVVTAVSIVVIVTNLGLIRDGVLAVDDSGIASDYGDYSYLTIEDLDVNVSDSESGERYDRVGQYYEEIYRDYYETAKPAICMEALEDSDRGITYVCVNEFAAGTLENFTADLSYDKGADAVYFIPENLDDENILENAGYCLSTMVDSSVELREETVFYSPGKSFTCIDSNAAYGVKTVRNPVIVYCNYSGAGNTDRLHMAVEPANVMFRLTASDLSDMEQRYGLDEDGYAVFLTGVAESYEYRSSAVRKALSFCSSVSVFMLILEAMLICLVNAMEYRARAIELALKKILGYGIWEKNRKIILACLLPAGITTVVLAVVGPLLQLFGAGACIGTGLCVMALELTVIVINIARTETKNIQKILKGGCL